MYTHTRTQHILTLTPKLMWKNNFMYIRKYSLLVQLASYIARHIRLYPKKNLSSNEVANYVATEYSHSYLGLLQAHLIMKLWTG